MVALAGAVSDSNKGRTGAPILVVDDDVDVQTLVRDLLEAEGYDVSTANNGLAALEQLETARPALILLDMNMPGMNGWEFARAYRKAPSPHVPIIVFTAGPVAQVAAREINADGFIAKPFDILELLAVISRHLASQESLASHT